MIFWQSIQSSNRNSLIGPDSSCCPSRKSSSWHTSLRIRKKSEKKEKEAKKETKLENGYRKSRDGLANKVSVKVSTWAGAVNSQWKELL